MKYNTTLVSACFAKQSTLDIAQSLLGKYLVRQTDQGTMIGKIVETEAYLQDDPAAHSSKGKTKRNALMFADPGYSYVYFIYGRYHCFNYVTSPEHVGEAVLIRALEPVFGIDTMKRHRQTHDLRSLCSGPGKLTMALDISHMDNGINLHCQDSTIRLEQLIGQQSFDVVKTTRIGISRAKDLPYRFYIKDNEYISKR